MDSDIWRFRGRKRDRKGMNLTCLLLNRQMKKKFLVRACKQNERGKGKDSLRMRNACCETCTDLGYPPK